MIVHLFPGLEALSTLEVVHTSSSCAGCGADPTFACLYDACELLEALAEVLLGHLEVLHAGLVAGTLDALGHVSYLLGVTESAHVVLLLCLPNSRFLPALGRSLLLC